MFNEGQEVTWNSLVPVRCKVLARRLYTEAYSHWDIEVLEPAFLEKQQIAFTGVRHLGIPEHQIT